MTRSLLFSSYEKHFRESVLLIVVYATVTSLALIPANVVDSDLGWHLRSGQWILQHHWVPYVDWFSTYGIGKPWLAYSWLFEVLIYALVSWMGLIGLVAFLYLLMLSIATAIYALLSKFEKRAVYAGALTTLVIASIARLRSPRPWLFTILFFTIELNILVRAQESRRSRTLYLLPLLFALWANLHIQFIYGLFVLVLFTVESYVASRFLRNQSSVEHLPTNRLAMITMSCVIATFLNPYHIRIYAVLLDTIKQERLYGLISELQAMPFRSIPDWLVLALAMGGALVFGLRRHRSLFWGALFISGAFLSFRSTRDVWFIAIVAAAVIAGAGSEIHSVVARQSSQPNWFLVLLATSLIFLITIRGNELSNIQLQKVMAREQPVAAANFAQNKGLQGRLYNHFDWGGFLAWQLPKLTVSIDGRSNLHHADRIEHSANVWNGQPGWESDSELSSADVVIAERQFALTQLLRLDARFTLIYEDDLGAIFVRRVQPTQ